MNRLLFDTLTFLNSFIAVAIIGLCALVGWGMPAFGGASIFGLLLGTCIGLVSAAIICGTLAFFALTERHLRIIADGTAPTDRRRAAQAFDGRREPSI